MSLSSSEVAFLAALRATDRSACNRWVKAQKGGADKEASKELWRAMEHLAGDELGALALRVLSAARGSVVDEGTPFPSMIWYGGADKTYGGHLFKGTFRDFIDHVLLARAKVVAEKRAGWVVTPTTSSDGHRLNASTLAVHALNLDCDDRADPAHLAALLLSLGFAFIVYESGGATASVSKWHLLIPLSRAFDTSSPEKIHAWKRAYNKARIVLGALGGLRGEGFDPTCETPSQPVFITERRRVEDAERRVSWQVGCTLNIEALAAGLPDPVREECVLRGPSSRFESEPLADERLEQIVQRLEEPMSQILSGRRDLYLALPGVLLDRGVVPDDVRAIIREISIRCPGDPAYTDEEVEEKHAEHLHCVETTIGKFDAREPYTRIGTLAEQWPEIAFVIDEIFPDALMQDLLARQRAKSVVPPSTPQETPPSSPSYALKAPATLEALQGRLRERRGYLRRSWRGGYHVKVKAEMLDAFIKGLDLVPRVEGEPVSDQFGNVFDRDRALGAVMWEVAMSFETDTPIESVKNLARASITAMLGDGETVESVMQLAQGYYQHAAKKKLGRKITRDSELAESGERDIQSATSAQKRGEF